MNIGSLNTNNQPANNLNSSSNNNKLIDIYTQTTLDVDEEITKDQLSLARESLQIKRLKRKESSEIQSKNFPSNSIQNIKCQIAELKSYINNLKNSISKYQEVVEQISDHFGSKNKTIYEIFQHQLNQNQISYSDEF